jgi:anaerobic selenocysteine-containing dehydrogenase
VLLKTPWNFPGWSEFYAAAQPRLEKQELWITNGRINEVWQSGFDDLRKPYTAARGLPQILFMHPEDARRRGIESGDRVRVSNDTVYVQTGMPLGVTEQEMNFNATAGRRPHPGHPGKFRGGGDARSRHASRRRQGRLQRPWQPCQRGEPCRARSDDQELSLQAGAGARGTP